MRINARLDDRYEERIAYLREETGLSLSDVVRESLEHYYASIKARKKQGQDALGALVGAFDGRPDSPEDLSGKAEDYLWRDAPRS